MRAFPVRMPSGSVYWTVLDDELRVVEAADRFLMNVRLSKDRAESTTKSYAGAIAMFLRWCVTTGRDWHTAARDLSSFILWLKWQPRRSEGCTPVVPGPGAKPVRGNRRINRILVAVRGFLAHAVTEREAPGWVLEQLYQLGDSLDLPLQAQGEDGRLRYRLQAQHRLPEAEPEVDRASDEEIVAMFRASRSARDRLLVLLLSRVGLRRGQAAGLRRSDVHLLMDSAPLGCRVEGAHLHVVRRQNPNQAWSKSRRPVVLPVDFLVVQAFDQYALERHERLGAAGSDFVLVNLFREPLGSPVTPDAIGETVASLARQAGLDRKIAPHMMRHAMASNVADSGGTLDEIQALLGQKHPDSARPYLHPAATRLRAAVDRVPSPRELSEVEV
ncbi:tyrosine-type recombinase/integrase [Streptomyces diastatochromogenes]|nr:site-specific integrase [Streptomyces diastatochromogenes]MCZ0986941.1 tyrosine-type recombinase/integrase [Streptomyces diastatochromogenes]